MRPRSSSAPLQAVADRIQAGGETYPLILRRHARARRISLRYDPIARQVILTLPRRGSVREALAFAEEKRGWLARVIAEHPAAVALLPGATIPILGEEYRIVHSAADIGVAAFVGRELHVTGAAEHIPRRLKDWLKQYLKREITPLAHAKAAELERSIQRIGVRDMRSRWGSCSSDGNLAFSRRLVFAPREVMEYVVCHEAAHLVEMGHTERFWRLVRHLYPHTEYAYNWLKDNGKTLYRFG